ncbi:MAG: FliM/FliN family flagellar motor switch protein, partial [Chitinivibrionales bacterium]
MSDFLNQDQIDALLSQEQEGSFDSDNENKEKESGGTGNDTTAMESAWEFFNESAASTLGSVTGKSVSLSLEKVEPASEENLKEATGKHEGSLVIKIELESGLQGTVSMYISQKIAAVLSDLMVMGTGEAEYDKEQHIEAMGELMSQVMGAYNTAVGSRIGQEVSLKNIDVNEVSQDDDLGSVIESGSVFALDKISVEELGEGEIGFVIPEGIASALSESFKPEGADNDFEESETAEVSSGLSGEPDDASFDEKENNLDFTKKSDVNIDLLMDIELDLTIELGGSEVSIKRILELAPGSVLELDRMAGEPVD